MAKELELSPLKLIDTDNCDGEIIMNIAPFIIQAASTNQRIMQSWKTSHILTQSSMFRFLLSKDGNLCTFNCKHLAIQLNKMIHNPRGHITHKCHTHIPNPQPSTLRIPLIWVILISDAFTWRFNIYASVAFPWCYTDIQGLKDLWRYNLNSCFNY